MNARPIALAVAIGLAVAGIAVALVPAQETVVAGLTTSCGTPAYASFRSTSEFKDRLGRRLIEWEIGKHAPAGSVVPTPSPPYSIWQVDLAVGRCASTSRTRLGIAAVLLFLAGFVVATVRLNTPTPPRRGAEAEPGTPPR